MEHTHDNQNHSHHNMTNFFEHIFLGWALFCAAIAINYISIPLIQTVFAMANIPLWSFDWTFIEHTMALFKFAMTMITMAGSLFFSYRGYKNSQTKKQNK